MIYWFLLILGCQACTKSLSTYVSNIDSYYVGFFILLRSYVCKILGLYEILMYVCRIYWFLMSTIFPVLNSYVCRSSDNLFQTGILCSKKAVYLKSLHAPFPSLLPPLFLVDCCFLLPPPSSLPLPSCLPRPSCHRCRRAAASTKYVCVSM